MEETGPIPGAGERNHRRSRSVPALFPTAGRTKAPAGPDKKKILVFLEHHLTEPCLLCMIVL